MTKQSKKTSSPNRKGNASNAKENGPNRTGNKRPKKLCRSCELTYDDCKCERKPPTCFSCGQIGHKKIDCRSAAGYIYKADPDRASGEADGRAEAAEEEVSRLTVACHEKETQISELSKVEHKEEKDDSMLDDGRWFLDLGSARPAYQFGVRFFDGDSWSYTPPEIVVECPAPYPSKFSYTRHEPIRWTEEDRDYARIDTFTKSLQIGRKLTPLGTVSTRLAVEPEFTKLAKLIAYMAYNCIATKLSVNLPFFIYNHLADSFRWKRLDYIPTPWVNRILTLVAVYSVARQMAASYFKRYTVSLGRHMMIEPEDKRPIAQASGDLIYQDPIVYTGEYCTEEITPILPCLSVLRVTTRDIQAPIETVMQVTHPGIDQFTKDNDEVSSKIQYTIARTHAVNALKSSPLDDTYHTREASLVAFGIIRRGEQQRQMADFRWQLRRPP
jgi:hypothetical protein